MTATLTTAGPETAPPSPADLRALAELVERHDATRAVYLARGAEERGEERWRDGSLHLTYHASLARLCAALIAFERKHGFVPELG